MENHSDLILEGYLTKDENSVLIYSPSQTFIPKLWNGVFSIHWKMVGMKIVSKKVVSNVLQISSFFVLWKEESHTVWKM